MRSWALTAIGAALWMTAHPASAACLRKPLKIDAVHTAYSFVLAPEREVAAYTSDGFTRVECPADRSVVRQYVKQICEGTLRKPNPAMSTNADFERVRAHACASARAALTESGG